MTWDCLSEEIGGMFEEHTWRVADIDLALEAQIATARVRDAERKRIRRSSQIFASRERVAGKRWRSANQDKVKAQRERWYSDPTNRAKHIERTRLWKLANPDKTRTAARKSTQKWKDALRARDPDGYRKMVRAGDRRYRERNLEKLRERDRLRKAKWRQRKRLAVNGEGQSAARKAA